MKRLLLLTLLALLATLALHAQEGAGRTYLLAFPDTTANTFDARFPNERFADRALIYIYSAVDNQVRIEGVGYEKLVNLRGGEFATVDLLDSVFPAPDPIATRSNVVASNSFRLDADEPVIVYCFLLTRFGSEAWTPLPVESWGEEYFVAARAGEVMNDISTGGPFDYNKKSKMASAQITIVAAFDDTRVSIRSNAALLDSIHDIDVTLDAGEVYQVQSHVDTSVFADLQPDIGGSRITATRPIGVLSGNTRAQALYFQEGLGQNIFKNMLVEWLSPVEMHGVEFVYMPTWDAQRPTGMPGEDLGSKRKGEFVRIYASTPGTTRGVSLDNNIGRTHFSIQAAGRFREDFIGTPEARHYRLDRPAQVMMNSTAIVHYRGYTGGGGYIGAEFLGWGAYMTELVPRHRWSSFAPFHSPAMSDSMWHYINVVTDSVHRYDVYMENGERFDFNRGTIHGTGLIWGTMEVAPGRLHYLEGRNGARFSGHVYGLWRGREEYRPGGAKSDYEEYLAVSYGYPLSSRHFSSGQTDSVTVDTATGCTATTITITQTATAPAGIDSIWLEWSNNARLVSIQPLLLRGSTTARIVVAPIEPAYAASAVVVMRDATGKLVRYRHLQQAETVQIYSPPIFREYVDPVVPGKGYPIEIVVRNPLDKSITIDDVRLAHGNRGYTLASVDPEHYPLELPPGEDLLLSVIATPEHGHATFLDSLIVVGSCLTTKSILQITTTVPRISATDIDFGTFVGLGANSSETMTITNGGDGHLMFGIGSAGDSTWPHPQHFTIHPAEMERLRTARLRKGDTLTLNVSFRGVTEGTFIDTVTFFSNDSKRTDPAIWRATVRRVSDIGESSSTGRERVIVHPNPATASTTFSFRMQTPGSASLTIADAAGRTVARFAMERLEAGEQSFVWDVSAVPAGIYFYRLESDTTTTTGSITVGG